MIIALLSMFFKCVSTILEFIVTLIISAIQFIFVTLFSGISEWLKLSKEYKSKKNPESNDFKTSTESEIPKNAKFVLLEMVESEWYPIGYYATYMEAYTEKIARQTVPKSKPMIIQEIK